MTVHYRCTAGHSGSYDPATITTTTDASLPDAKHQKSCGAALITSLTPSLLDRFAVAA
jgi:hypothetical protein